jgi:hypothetical protein
LEILFVQGLYLRTGDTTYKALAKQWSKVAITIFAVGVVTGTILSFELGLLWPHWMARYGEVFGIGFAIEGISFFLEAIFIAIYVYGWERLPRRTHFLVGIPVVISGFAGFVQCDRSQRVDERPDGVQAGPERRRAGPAAVEGGCSTATSGMSSCTCTWRATSSPGSSSPACMRSAG